MVGMKPREKEEVVPTTEKSKTFGTVSAITLEAKQDEEQVKRGSTATMKKQFLLSWATSWQSWSKSTKN